jgi:hypothetical protein
VDSHWNKRSSLSAGIYFDNDFAALVGARAGEHFVRRNRLGKRKNATYGYRQFMSFVQLCKLR